MKYFDEFILNRISRGEQVTPELIEVNKELKDKDRFKELYKKRPVLCRLGLHRRVQSVWGGGFPDTCRICWYHELQDYQSRKELGI